MDEHEEQKGNIIRLKLLVWSVRNDSPRCAEDGRREREKEWKKNWFIIASKGKRKISAQFLQNYVLLLIAFLIVLGRECLVSILQYNTLRDLKKRK